MMRIKRKYRINPLTFEVKIEVSIVAVLRKSLVELSVYIRFM